MLQIYIKLAIRNLLANKLVTAINITGLSIAIGCSIVVFLFLKNYITLDNFHENGDRIFMLEHVVENEGQEEIRGTSPMPLGPALATDFPQVERAVRVDMQGARVFLEDRRFDELVFFADPGYFDMFTFPLQTGSPAALNEPDAVILSDAAARKYFNGEDAMGQSVTLVFENQLKKVFTVKGVAAPFPENTGFAFDILAGFHTLAGAGMADTADWKTHTRGAFVQLRNGADIGVLAGKMDRYVAQYNANNREEPIKSFVFDNLNHPNAGAYNVQRRPTEAAHPLLIAVFALVALMMMALSCFNYINIALGHIGKRLKEIGIRKTVGGRKMQLVGQFMTENLLLCFFALLAGLVLAKMALAPFLNSVFVDEMQISLAFDKNYALWVFLFGLLIFTAIASGAYPAFYISAFQPVSIFKGKQQFSGKKGVTSVLLPIQFVLAFSTVIIGVVLTAAGWYWKDAPWGYQPDQTLVVRLDSAGQYAFLKNEAERSPRVLGVAGAASHVGESYSRETVLNGVEKTDVIRYDVGAGYFEAAGLRLKAGRFFDERRPAEDAGAVVVNETFVKKQDWTEAIGQEIRTEEQKAAVVGVVEDFKLFGSGAARPAVFHLAGPGQFNYLAIRHEAGADKTVQAFMKSAWERLYPATPFNYFRQAAVFDDFYRGFGNVARVFHYIAGLALLIACMGLFGLAAQNYSSRLKEVSIRKVLGANTFNIILLVNRRFLVLLVTAGLIATAICYTGAQLLVRQAQEFTGELQLGIAPYLLANLLVLLAAAIAVGGQTWQLARTAPVEALRNE